MGCGLHEKAKDDDWMTFDCIIISCSLALCTLHIAQMPPTPVHRRLLIRNSVIKFCHLGSKYLRQFGDRSANNPSWLPISFPISRISFECAKKSPIWPFKKVAFHLLWSNWNMSRLCLVFSKLDPVSNWTMACLQAKACWEGSETNDKQKAPSYM